MCKCEINNNFIIYHFSVGIIGEMISGFNPFTLAPFGDENEDEDDESENGEQQVENTNNKQNITDVEEKPK